MTTTSSSRTGLLADVTNGKFFCGRISWNAEGVITLIEETPGEGTSDFITPPLVNAHVHVESSMLVPSRFGPPCLACGVGATVSDPHEIANVLGVAGVEFMIENAKLTPLRIHFGAPSCVPATNATFETAGAELDAKEIDKLMQMPEIHYLAEVMNFPGVLAGEPGLMAKIASAKRVGKRIDGHAPGLQGDEARRYAAHGISTDHECFTLEEALDKISCGMKVLIREGSAAKNFEALWSIVNSQPSSAMLCSDDLHPDEILTGNIDSLCRRLLTKGCKLLDVLRVASLNPVTHYGLDLGLLRVGDKADFVVWKDDKLSSSVETVLAGQTAWRLGDGLDGNPPNYTPNRFEAAMISSADLRVPAQRGNEPIIEVIDHQIVTKRTTAKLPVKNGEVLSDIEHDIVKLVVVNRYDPKAKPSVCFVKNTGIKHGAISSSVAHDSHNVIACGADDASLVAVINATIAASGGIGCVVNGRTELLPLPVAGLMSDRSVVQVGEMYRRLSEVAKSECGSTLTAPYMTLSFLALLVIPELKLSDKGLFDVKKFAFVARR